MKWTPPTRVQLTATQTRAGFIPIFGEFRIRNYGVYAPGCNTYTTAFFAPPYFTFTTAGYAANCPATGTTPTAS